MENTARRVRDPMGVKRRWGRRELAFLIGSLLVLAAAALLTRTAPDLLAPEGRPEGTMRGMAGPPQPNAPLDRSSSAPVTSD